VQIRAADSTKMRALTVVPGGRESGRLTELDEPAADRGSLLIETSSVGICDIEIVRGAGGSGASRA